VSDDSEFETLFAKAAKDIEVCMLSCSILTNRT